MLQRSKSLNEKAKKYLEITYRKLSYLKTLCDDFFELSVIEANDNKIIVTKINLNNLLSDIILEQYHWISERNIKTNFKIFNEDIFINSNEEYLKRIIYNLFSNVQKYKKSYLNFECKYKDNNIVITIGNDVEDSLNIDAKEVFDIFYRGKSRNKDGAGLGLFVLKSLCNKLGYEIQAKCTNGKFFITLIIHG